MLLTYAGSNVFQLYTAIHLSGEGSDGGDTEFRPGLESFSITYDVSLESTLIELPNLFFKQQCPGPDPWRETIRYKFKIRQFAYFIFLWCIHGRRWPTYGDFPLISNQLYSSERSSFAMTITVMLQDCFMIPIMWWGCVSLHTPVHHVYEICWIVTHNLLHRLPSAMAK